MGVCYGHFSYLSIVAGDLTPQGMDMNTHTHTHTHARTHTRVFDKTSSQERQGWNFVFLASRLPVLSVTDCITLDSASGHFLTSRDVGTDVDKIVL